LDKTEVTDYQDSPKRPAVRTGRRKAGVRPDRKPGGQTPRSAIRPAAPGDLVDRRTVPVGAGASHPTPGRNR